MTIILVTECHLVLRDVQQTIVRDRHAMSIAPDVVQYLLGSCERPLGVDHPFGLAQGSQAPRSRRWVYRAANRAAAPPSSTGNTAAPNRLPVQSPQSRFAEFSWVGTVERERIEGPEECFLGVLR
jgi:hypothetical protein